MSGSGEIAISGIQVSTHQLYQWFTLVRSTSPVVVFVVMVAPMTSDLAGLWSADSCHPGGYEKTGMELNA